MLRPPFHVQPWLSSDYVFPPDVRYPNGLTVSGIGSSLVEQIWRQAGSSTKVIAKSAAVMAAGQGPVPETTVVAVLSDRMDTFPQSLKDENAAAAAASQAAFNAAKPSELAIWLAKTRW